MSDRTGPVRRAIVYHRNPEVDSLLLRQGLQAPSKAVLLIPGGNNHMDGYLGVSFWHRNRVIIRV